MIAPHVGQPGRSNTLGTESVGKGSGSLWNDPKNFGYRGGEVSG